MVRTAEARHEGQAAFLAKARSFGSGAGGALFGLGRSKSSLYTAYIVDVQRDSIHILYTHIYTHIAPMAIVWVGIREKRTDFLGSLALGLLGVSGFRRLESWTLAARLPATKHQ